MNQSAIRGEEGTGFEHRGKLGPFACKNCEYFKEGNSSCGQEDMVRLSKQPRTADGRVQVGPEDCCEFIERIAKFK
jgi:hypothetical protein